MKEICQTCEHRLLSECKGSPDNAPDIHTDVCYLENIYGLALDSSYLENNVNAYRKKAIDWTPEETKAAFLKEICTIDVHLHGTNSELYPLWNLGRAISVLGCLEIYSILNVTLTLEDTKGESFYAGIPQVSAKDIRLAKKYLKKFDANTIAKEK